MPFPFYVCNHAAKPVEITSCDQTAESLMKTANCRVEKTDDSNMRFIFIKVSYKVVIYIIRVLCLSFDIRSNFQIFIEVSCKHMIHIKALIKLYKIIRIKSSACKKYSTAGRDPY